MQLALGFILLILLVLFVAGFLFKKPASKVPDFPYVLKSTFLSPAERSFLDVLSEAVSGRGIVFPKVRVADVLSPKKGLLGADWQKAFNRIASKHFDFVVCHPKTLDPLLAIELDDSSHQKKENAMRDAVKDAATKSAGFPFIRIKVQNVYAVRDIQDSISNYL